MRAAELVVERKPIAHELHAARGHVPVRARARSRRPLHRAALVQTSPPGVAAFDLDADAPDPLSFHGIGPDSDSDGRDDASAIAPTGASAFRRDGRDRRAAGRPRAGL
jgi:hypothetical protein